MRPWYGLHIPDLWIAQFEVSSAARPPPPASAAVALAEVEYEETWQRGGFRVAEGVFGKRTR
jgi:hypothetical protein